MLAGENGTYSRPKLFSLAVKNTEEFGWLDFTSLQVIEKLSTLVNFEFFSSKALLFGNICLNL